MKMRRFPVAEGKEVVSFPEGDTGDIVSEVYSVYSASRLQVADFVQPLQGLPVVIACRSIFDFIADSTEYRLDPPGKQWIKTPARFIADRSGDCKSYAIFICSCLSCLGIPHLFRFASYSTDPEPTHVYAVAIDELGNEIVCDPVNRENGVPLFNEEVIYKHIQDMKGSTQISRLSGIGFPGPNRPITRLPQVHLSRARQDLLVALNILQLRETTFRRAGEKSNLKDTLNRIDIVLLALLAYDSTLPSSATTDQLHTALLFMAQTGRFDNPADMSDTDREYFRMECLTEMDKLGADMPANPEAYAGLYEIAAGDVVAQLSGVGSAVAAPSQDESFVSAYNRNFSTPKKQASVADAQKVLIDRAEYFMYCFISESDLSEFPDTVSQKRAEHYRMLQDIAATGVMTRPQMLATVQAAIAERYGSVALFLNGLKNGSIDPAAIGALTEAVILAIISACVSVLIALIEGIFGGSAKGKQLESDFEVYAPGMQDGFINSDDNPTFGSGGNSTTKVVSSLSKYLPFILIGAVLLIPSGDKKKK